MTGVQTCALPISLAAALVTFALAMLAAAATASAALLLPALGAGSFLLAALYLAVERRAPMDSASAAPPSA